MADLLTLAEAAQRVRLSARTLRRALADPVCPLRCYRLNRRVIRIDPGDLEAWVRAHRAAVPVAVSGTSPIVRDMLRKLKSAPQAHSTAKSSRKRRRDLRVPTPVAAAEAAENTRRHA